MRIERIRVEEGFLDGLDLQFSPGLNVLIGSRGCGKTSIIELLRFCLEIPGYSAKATEVARAHALGVLGQGRVTVDVHRNGRTETFSRTATTGASGLTGDPQRPIILSQNQIELLGSDSRQLLRLIDEFTPTSQSLREQEKQLSARINSLSSELKSKREELEALMEQAIAFKEAPEQLRLAEAAQSQSSGALEQLRPHQERLDFVSRSAAASGVRSATLSAALQEVQRYANEVDATRRSLPPLAPWPASAGAPDLLQPAREQVIAALDLLTQARAAIGESYGYISNLVADNAKEREQLEQEHLSLRKSLEAAQAGAGVAAQNVAVLRSQVAQARSLLELCNARQAEYDRLHLEREVALDELDSARQARFQARTVSTTMLSEMLGPAIQVDLRLFGQQSSYREDLTSILRGSGLRYSTLVPVIADAMSPRELVEVIESIDPDKLAQIAGLPVDRAVRVLTHLAQNGGEQLLVSPLDDGVGLSLLDGKNYKPLAKLSTGQRCTVILPIFLAHPTRPVVVDQPEDNLDNAFIVSTLVKALQARKSNEGGQLLIATHNANVPVLGGADLVVHLGSDGARAFVQSAERLDAPTSVKAITEVMEGGREAFALRASFYGVPNPSHG